MKVVIKPATIGGALVIYALAHLNPPRTHKFYAARHAVYEAVKRGVRAVTVGTCGNYGRAIAYCSATAKLDSHLFVPETYAGPEHLAEYQDARVTLVPGTYEDAVEASIGHARVSGLLDANPTHASPVDSLEGYRRLGEEIIDGLDRPATHVWVPVGNGTTLVGVAEGFWRRGMKPVMVAVGSVGNTAATASVRAGQAVDLNPDDLRVTHANEPLINWHSYHGQETVDVVRASDGWACDLDDDALLAAVTLAEGAGVRCTPSGGAAVSAFAQWAAGKDVSRQTHVLVITA